MPSHPLTNFEIQKYYKNERGFNGIYSRDNLYKIKDGAYVINIDGYSNIGTHWVALYIQNNNVTYFDSFGVEHIPKEIRTFIGNKNITTNIFRIQAYDLIMCGYFCIGFINFMLAGKTLTDYTNLFSPHDFKKNDDIILTYFYIILLNLTEQTKFRLSETMGIENYFHQEINQRKSCSKKLSKYVTAFDYIDNVLIVLSATSDGVSIISFTSIAGAPIGTASESFTLIFSLETGIVKKLLNITRNKKEKHYKILMLAKSKLNSIETSISHALIDMEISHEEFITILNEKDKYEKMKDNLRSENEKYVSNDTSCKQRIKL